jgi:transposase
MAHFHVKTKKGRPYLYIRETARVGGKPRVVSQVYLGSPERVLQRTSGQAGRDQTFQVQEFGALWAALQMDRDVDLAAIVDAVVPRAPKETGPSVGEYFLYSVLNRMVEAKSKRALPDWYHDTAIQQLRPVDVAELSSERYWAKWDRVSTRHLEQIGRRFFERIWELEKPQADCVLFDTTNYYTYMASDTKSELAKRGNSKASKHHLRQLGLGLLVSRGSQLPLYYCVYPGNRHDSKQFAHVMDEMLNVVLELDKTKERLTVVFDKGMNSEGNFAWIDEHQCVHFITSYSPYFAQDLAEIPLDRFEPVDTRKNRALTKKDREADRLVAYRTTGEFWGKQRAVVVTHYPPTARKQDYTFQAKLAQVRAELLVMREKANTSTPQWRNADDIQERYHRLCERLHISSDYYDLEFTKRAGSLVMGFRKNHYAVDKKRSTFGKSIIVTDNTDWATVEIVEANLDRWQVENGFRQSKDHDLVGTQPVRHWTDSKLRCHLFTCVVALTYLRRLELRLRAKGSRRTANTAMEKLRKLHSILSISRHERQPRRYIEQPRETQAEVLSALGYRIDPSGGLQPLHP